MIFGTENETHAADAPLRLDRKFAEFSYADDRQTRVQSWGCLAKAQFDGRVARALRCHVEDQNAATSGDAIAGAAMAEILAAWKTRDPSLDLAPVYAYACRDSALGDFLAGLVAEVGSDGLQSWCADPTMPSQMRLLVLRQVLIPHGPAASLVKRVADIVKDGKLLDGGPPGESPTRSLLAATLAGRRLHWSRRVRS